MLYNPMSHGAHTSLYNPMTHGAHASLYNPMTHGDLYLLYNVVWPHDPWGFVTIAAPMTHGEKVAEGAHPHLPILCQYLPLPSSLSHSFPLLSIIISVLGLQPKTEKKA